MSAFGQSTIQPVQVNDFLPTYNATCGLCGRIDARCSQEAAEAWLEEHIDKRCRVACFLRAVEREGLTPGEVVNLAKGVR